MVNVGDDVTLHGLRICPDLDSVMYTLGGGADPERGWGRVGETWTVKEELAAYGAEPTWFGLGDKDVATHLVRTRMLDAGYPLSAVTEALCARWQPGVRLLPASDDRVETHVVVDVDGRRPERAIHFQEWWVRHRAALPAQRFVFVGAETAKPAPGCSTRSAEADVVLLAPSNPVVSIAPILAVPALRDGGGRRPGPGGRASPRSSAARRCAAWPTVPGRARASPCTAAGVGALYGARADGGVLDAWLVDPVDAGDRRCPGVAGPRSAPLWMTDEDATAAMVAAALGRGGCAA